MTAVAEDVKVRHYILTFHLLPTNISLFQNVTTTAQALKVAPNGQTLRIPVSPTSA